MIAISEHIARTGIVAENAAVRTTVVYCGGIAACPVSGDLAPQKRTAGKSAAEMCDIVGQYAVAHIIVIETLLKIDAAAAFLRWCCSIAYGKSLYYASDTGHKNAA